VTHEHRIRAALRARPVLADALLAVALLVVAVLPAQLAGGALRPPSWPAALGWLALGLVPVALRRRFTWPAVALLAVHTVLSPLAAAGLVQTAGLAVAVLTYTAAAYLPLRPAGLATAVLWLPALAASALAGAGPPAPVPLPRPYLLAFNVLAFNVLVALVCFLVGRTLHHRRAYVAALEDRARAAELDQQARTAQAVADERRRIARELHDMVAHHVAVMGVLATGSRRTLRRDPAATDEALATIEETGRTALREMRRLLDVLRTEQEPADELTPQPGLAGLTPLVDQVREAGLPVRLAVAGDSRGLDPGVALTVYRIVQEALTNALKHAGEATAEVRLDLGTHWLTVEVCDTGRGPQLDGNRLGHGLLGMRERVTLYGGTLRTGPRPGGGFRVYARIPVDRVGADAVQP
jgi:signal transduction histidine kinase